jgi:hypothetical protein
MTSSSVVVDQFICSGHFSNYKRPKTQLCIVHWKLKGPFDRFVESRVPRSGVRWPFTIKAWEGQQRFWSFLTGIITSDTCIIMTSHPSQYLRYLLWANYNLNLPIVSGTCNGTRWGHLKHWLGKPKWLCEDLTASSWVPDCSAIVRQVCQGCGQLYPSWSRAKCGHNTCPRVYHLTLLIVS